MLLQSVTRVRVVSGVLVLLGLSTIVTGCKQEIQFTKAPPVGSAPMAQVRREPTTIGLGVAIDIRSATDIADKAIPQNLGKLVEWMDDAACAKRTRWVECNGAKAEIDVERAGPVTIATDGGRISIQVPLKYSINARGLGWASFIRDTKSGEFVASVPIDAAILPGFEPDVRFREPVSLSERTIPILTKGKLGLARALDQRLKKPLAPVADAIRESIRAKGLKSVAERAWRVLYTPIELARDPQMWLRIEPERITGADFTSDGDDLLFRYSIGARVSVVQGQRPAPMLPRPLPDISRAGTQAQAQQPVATQLRLPVVIGSEPLLIALREAFPRSEVLKTAATQDGPQISAKVRQLTLFPSRGLLGIEVLLDVVEPSRWAGMIGTVHFLAKPVIRTNGLLELESVGLPDLAAPKGARGGVPVPPTPPNQPRVGAEPFAGRIAQKGKMAVGNVLRDVLPHANALVDQPLGDGFALAGRFDDVKILAIDPVRDGFEITFNLTGNLTLRYLPEAMAAPVQPEPGTR